MKLAPIDLRVRLYGSFADPDVWIESGLYSFFRLRDMYSMQPDFHMLDLGCGAGRVALPLIPFLNKSGHYYGLDICKEMMDWCSLHLGSDNMEFTWANVGNSLYFDSATSERDYNYKFPYASNSLDFGFGFSIFTHLLEAGARNYFNEISRTLKVGGKFMFSTFVLDSKTQANVDAGKCAWSLKYSNSDICKYDLEQSPDTTVAYTKNGMEQMIKDAGMKIESFLQGNWHETPHGSHDEIFVEKL